MSPNPGAVTRTRADAPHTFLAINRPPLAPFLGAAPLHLLTHPKSTTWDPKITPWRQNAPRGEAGPAPTGVEGSPFPISPPNAAPLG